MELMALLYVLLAKARKEGTLTLESDIDDPAKSASTRRSWRIGISSNSLLIICA
ncbi:MAG: Flagellar motor rotation protein MotA [uncultured Caballeronia sp.]|nr:MAG: Flagellar motor rotation protein MotA [uncultured Caballeronia sp.]